MPSATAALREKMSTCVVDEQQPSATEHRENWGAVVRDQPTATPDPTETYTCRHQFRAVCQIGMRPGHISQLQGFHEGPRFQNCVELFQRTQTDPLHPSICHMPGSPVTCYVFSIVSTRLRQCSTRRLACPRTEQTSVSPECWCAAHLLGKQVRSRFIATARLPMVAGTAANRLQDCCSRISVSARTCSGVSVCWSTEHQGPAVQTATTVMVVGHVSRPYVAAVHCWRPHIPDCHCTSLEHSVAGRSFI